MSNLINLSSEIVMTSLEVVELINKFREEEGNDLVKKHDVLLRDIRKEIELLENAGLNGFNNFVESSYINKQNKEQLVTESINHYLVKSGKRHRKSYRKFVS